MNNNIDHLSDWQIEELLIDPVGAPVETGAQSQWLHLEQCPLCSAKKNRLEAALLLYREAALLQAAALLQSKDALRRIPARGATASRKAHSFSPYRLLWGWHARVLALLLLLIALLPAFVARQRAHHQATQAAANHLPARPQAQDDLLLQQVDQEITESVPQPMQSLIQPVLDLGSEQR